MGSRLGARTLDKGGGTAARVVTGAIALGGRVPRGVRCVGVRRIASESVRAGINHWRLRVACLLCPVEDIAVGEIGRATFEHGRGVGARAVRSSAGTDDASEKRACSSGAKQPHG